jgi:TP901 family phage tail tape measure protein
MSLLGNIWVKLGLKSDDFNRGMDSAEKKSKTFGDSMKAVATKVMAVVAAIKALAGTVKIITNFEAATSKLASVLGKTRDQITGLTNSAIELGRKTQYTASEVVGLQTELAKLGFTENQIKSMQEAVLKFAAAVGTDLPSAAARAGATMRGFGLTAEQTADTLEVMAVSTSKSALSFNYLDSTLGKLVPVTKAYGLDVRDTITLLGTLANAGIDASSAGTALRRVFAELANADSKLNKTLGKQPKTMTEVIEALKKLKASGMGVQQAFDLVGKYAGPAFEALVNGADDCEQLYNELQDVNGALNTMYDTMTNNVTGAVNQLKSAWEGFILGLENSTGPMARVLRGLTKIVNEANKLLFRDTRVNQNKEYYDLLWNGKGGFDRNDTWAVQTRFTKERQRLEAEKQALIERFEKKRRIAGGDYPGVTVEDTKKYKELQEQIDGLEASYDDWFSSVSDGATEAAGALAGLGGAEEDAIQQLLKEEEKRKKREEQLKAEKEELERYVDEAMTAADADAEMTRQAEELMRTYKQLHPAIEMTAEEVDNLNGLTDKGKAIMLGSLETTRDAKDEVVGLAREVGQLVEAEQEGTLGAGKMKDALIALRSEFRVFKDAFTLTDAEAEMLTGLSDKQLEEELNAVIEKQERAAERMRDIWEDASDEIVHAIRGGMINAFDALAEAIGTGDWDTSTMVKALLTPLADAAISIGTIVMTSGEAMDALNKALKSMGENAVPATIIGAALVGVGLAAKAGLAAIANKSTSAGSTNHGYTYTGGYGVTPAAVSSVGGTMEIQGTVTVKGQDIQIALDNYNKNRKR